MSAEDQYRLLQTFRQLFEGVRYFHRNSSLGDAVATQLYEDLVVLNKSSRLAERVSQHDRVINLKNVAVGRSARRGDGTFGGARACRGCDHGKRLSRRTRPCS